MEKLLNTDCGFPPIQPNKDMLHPTFLLIELYTDTCHQKVVLLQYPITGGEEEKKLKKNQEL